MVPSPLLKQVQACGIVCFDTIIYQVSNSSIWTIRKYILIQECIPVGCVPPAAVAVGGSASVHAGVHSPLPAVGLETSLGVGLETPPPDVGLETTTPPPQCGPGTPLGQTPQLPPWVWA